MYDVYYVWKAKKHFCISDWDNMVVHAFEKEDIYELNLDIIRYKVDNPLADKDQIITYIQSEKDRSRIRPDDEGWIDG